MRRLLLFLFFLFGSDFLWAEKISAYEINVTVKQSGELYVVESIEYDFEGASKHGIIRDIPHMVKINAIKRDLGLYNFSVVLDGSEVKWDKSTMNSSKAGTIIRLKIGSASTSVTGKHIYRIDYNVKRGVLPTAGNDKNDVVRWNIVGTGWGIPISKIKTNFFLPPSLTQQDIALSTYTGLYGVKTSTATSAWIDTRHLQVKVPYLKPYEGATVELAYPADILEQSGAKNLEPTLLEWFMGIWHWGALAGFLLYFRTIFSRHRGFVDTRSVSVQYEAPKGLSLLESGLILDKFTDNEDFSAAVLELAQLGYIEIHQKEKRDDPLLKRTDKSIEDLSMDQKHLLNNVLFGNSHSFSMSANSSAQSSILQKGFEDINTNLYLWSVSKGYLVENPQRVRKNFLWKSLVLLVPVFALIVYGIYINFDSKFIAIMIFPLVFGGVGLSMIITSKSWSNKFMGLIFGLLGSLPTLELVGDNISFSDLSIAPFIVLAVLIVALVFTYKSIGKYTQKGAYAHTHLLGLKEFIQRVKEDEIKRQLVLDPLYLEKLLPYAVLFKETKHWMSFYDILDVKSPQWYHGDRNNIRHFSSSVDSAATSPSSSASNGGGGFSGGGGSSGGGGGGGGGSSW